MAYTSRGTAFASALVLGVGTAAAPALADEISITDQRGKTVTLKGPAERVVTFPMPAAALFSSVDGSADRQIAMHPASRKAIQDGILGTIYPAALKVETGITKGGAFNPNVESVLALKPDLVIQWAGRGDDLLAPMDAVGLNVIGLTYGSQAETETWIKTLAMAVAKPERAELILGYHRDALATIKAKVAAIPRDQRRSILYFGQAEKNLQVRGEGSYNHFYMELTGGINAAAEAGDTVEINAEQLLAWNPDVLLLGNFDAAVPDTFYKDPRFAGLKAVQNRQVYKVPLGGYRWDPPSQESPLMWQWLAQVMYPDVFAGDLRGTMRGYYKAVYGYELTDAEIDGILFMDLNGANTGYKQFAS